MDQPEKYIVPAAQPHKAVIRMVTDIFPLRPDGELHPVPSATDTVVLDVIYSENLEECKNLANARRDEWKMKAKSES
jgi:hypothetical protein